MDKKIPYEIASRLNWTRKGKMEQSINHVESIEPLSKSCRECGKVVNKDQVEDIKVDNLTGVLIRKCKWCRSVFNPQTGLHDLPNNANSVKIIRDFYNKDK